MNSEAVAIIPARGGSKRIPNKNIREFHGKPIIAYSIEAAIESGLFKRVIVTTDSEDIAEVAGRFGAEVPFIRPADLADDITGTDPVIVHALKALAQDGFAPELVCCIYATAPFVEARYIKQGLSVLVDNNADSAFSVTTFPYPIFRALKSNENGKIEMVWPEHLTSRSQDLPETYHDAGQFYWAKVSSLIEQGRFFSDSAFPVVLPRHLVQDIDTPEDWERAELMYKALHG